MSKTNPDETKKVEKIVCKYACGAEFERSGKGQTALMRHYQFDCPNKPPKTEESPKPPEATSEQDTRKLVGDDVLPGLSDVLTRIINEVSINKKTPAVVRMVENYLDNPKKSLEILLKTLTTADYKPSERKLICQNWANYLHIGDADTLIDGENEDQKKEEKAKEEKKTPAESLKEGIKQAYDAELERLNLLQVRKQIRDMERELEAPKQEQKKEEEKHTLIVDGATLKLTIDELLAWKKYLADQDEKKAERERRDREEKSKDGDSTKCKDEDLVEWPFGDHVIKVRHETIPMLVMQQTNKKAEDPMLKMVLEELKETREQFRQFQVQTLEKKVSDLEVYASQDPLDRIYTQKEKLEKLGLVGTTKPTAQERMYDMDGKKLDALLKIVIDKSTSTQAKVDNLLSTIGPPAQEYIKEMIMQMKAGRGVTGQEVPRTDQQATETLKNLEIVDKAMSEPRQPPVVVGEQSIVAKVSS